MIKNYPAVVEKLREDFETYWKRVSPEDRDRVVHVVDHESDPETYLHASDWYSEVVPWSHFSTSQGKKLSGDWHIKTERKGTVRLHPPSTPFLEPAKSRPIVAMRDGNWSLVAESDYEISTDNMFQESWFPTIKGGWTEFTNATNFRHVFLR